MPSIFVDYPHWCLERSYGERKLKSAYWTVLATSFIILLMGFLMSPPRNRAPITETFVLGPLRGTASQSNLKWIQISSGRIDGVHSDDASPPPTEAAEKSLGAGLYATPGLIDSHVHLPPAIALGHLDYFLLMFLMHGVTTIRELGTIGVDLEGLSESIQTGDRLGPRVFSCGRPLTGDSRGGGLPRTRGGRTQP